MNGKDVVTGLIDLGVGSATGNIISDSLGGGGMAGFVGGVVGGSIAAGLTNTVIEAVDDETGIVSDLGSVVDDILGLW